MKMNRCSAEIRRCRCAGTGGFTVLEILTSIVIFGILSAGAFRLVHTANRLRAREKMKADALMLTRNTMEILSYRSGFLLEPREEQWEQRVNGTGYRVTVVSAVSGDDQWHGHDNDGKPCPHTGHELVCTVARAGDNRIILTCRFFLSTIEPGQ